MLMIILVFLLLSLWLGGVGRMEQAGFGKIIYGKIEKETEALKNSKWRKRSALENPTEEVWGRVKKRRKGGRAIKSPRERQ